MLKVRETERIKVVADYFSSFAKTVTSFVFLITAAALVSGGQRITIQGVEFETKRIAPFFTVSIILSVFLLWIAYALVSLINDD